MFRTIRAFSGLAAGAALVLAAQPAVGHPGTGTATQPTCGSVVTQSVRLTSDLTCAGPGLIVQASASMKVDLGGHSISATGVGIDLRPGSSEVTVTSGRVSSLNADAPARLRALSMGRLDFNARIDAERITVTGETRGLSGGDRSHLQHSKLAETTLLNISEARLDHNVIGPMLLVESPRVVVESNVLERIHLTESDRVTISRNRAGGISARISWGITVHGNRVLGSGTGVGINLIDDVGSGPVAGAPAAKVTENVVRGFDIGMTANEASGELDISGNTLDRNATAGLSIRQGAFFPGAVTVTRNLFTRNGHASTTVDPAGRTVNDGAHVYVVGTWPSTVALGHNTAVGNAGFGIEAVGPAGSIIDRGRNVARQNGEGSCWGITCTPR